VFSLRENTKDKRQTPFSRKPLHGRLETKVILKDSLPELEEAFDYLVEQSGQGHVED